MLARSGEDNSTEVQSIVNIYDPINKNSKTKVLVTDLISEHKESFNVGPLFMSTREVYENNNKTKYQLQFGFEYIVKQEAKNGEPTKSVGIEYKTPPININIPKK